MTSCCKRWLVWVNIDRFEFKQPLTAGTMSLWGSTIIHKWTSSLSKAVQSFTEGHHVFLRHYSYPQMDIQSLWGSTISHRKASRLSEGTTVIHKWTSSLSEAVQSVTEGYNVFLRHFIIHKWTSILSEAVQLFTEGHHVSLKHYIDSQIDIRSLWGSTFIHRRVSRISEALLLFTDGHPVSLRQYSYK